MLEPRATSRLICVPRAAPGRNSLIEGTAWPRTPGLKGVPGVARLIAGTTIGVWARTVARASAPSGIARQRALPGANRIFHFADIRPRQPPSESDMHSLYHAIK